MKVKTSITLSDDVLEMVDQRARENGKSRSDFIEAAVTALLDRLARGERDARELETLNRWADALNEEAADVLEYQVPP